MSEAEKVEHPSWCDRKLCTAPEFRPTREEHAAGVDHGSHRSAPVSGYGGRGDLEMYLVNALAPWETGVFLVIGDGEAEVGSIAISEDGGGMALFELLAQEIGDLTRAYPNLYGERFGYVADATSSGETPAETQDVVESSPVDAEMPPLKADEMPPELQDALRQMSKRGRVVDMGTGQTVAEAGELVDDKEHQAEDEHYQLTVNDAAVDTGPLRQIRAAVAQFMTVWLADDPEGLAVDAQTLNMAFNGGAVQAALEERGEWYTMVGVHSDHPTMRIRVTRA